MTAADDMRARSTPRLRPFSAMAVLAVGVVVDMLIWVTVAMLEGNLAILAFHTMFLMVGLAWVVSTRREAMGIFFSAVLARDVFTVLGWYSTYDESRRFFLGSNEDASRFWNGSTLSYDMVSVSFEDPLFPRLNIFLRQLAESFSEPSYLANTQAVVFSGVMLVVFAYLLFDRLYGPRVARVAGYLMALHPTMVAFSTGLMRDELIGMFGFLMLYAISRVQSSPGWAVRIWMLGLAVGGGIALAYLRSISLAGFAIAGLVMLVSRTPLQPRTLSRSAKLWLLASLAALMAFAVIDRFDRFEDIMEYAIKARAGEGGEGAELNPDGITTKIAEASPALFFLISPLALMQPLPFYGWDAPAFLGGPPALLDIVIGIGGLTNQLLFGFYIIAIRYWFRTKDTVGIRIGLLFTLTIGALAMIGLGQIRMVMAHCYPFVMVGIALTLTELFEGSWPRIWNAFLTWLGSLSALYFAYLSYRQWDNGVLAILAAALAAFGLTRLWSLGGPAPTYQPGNGVPGSADLSPSPIATSR
jgi:hypothetical protein